MLDREKRLNEVYEHVHRYFNIHTKGEFADYIKYARAYISSAMNGNEKYLTDKLFDSICKAFPGVFDLEYLLTGKGSLLTIEEEVHNEDLEKLYNPQPIDQSSLVNALLASKDETIDSLKSRIADLQRTIADLQRTIADKEEIIKAREARISELERQLAAASTSDLSRYPFTIGAADEPKV